MRIVPARELARTWTCVLVTCLESDFRPSTDLVVNLSLMSCLYYYKCVIFNNGRVENSHGGRER